MNLTLFESSDSEELGALCSATVDLRSSTGTGKQHTADTGTVPLSPNTVLNISFHY